MGDGSEVVTTDDDDSSSENVITFICWSILQRRQSTELTLPLILTHSSTATNNANLFWHSHTFRFDYTLPLHQPLVCFASIRARCIRHSQLCPAPFMILWIHYKNTSRLRQRERERVKNLTESLKSVRPFHKTWIIINAATVCACIRYKVKKR